MTDTETRTASIPFAGFYDSSHDSALDQALFDLFQDDSGEQTPAYDIAFDAIDWRAAHVAYAEKYCSNLALEIGATWQFAKLDSPHEYNFRSDEIDVTLALSELQAMRDYILSECEPAWLKLCKDRLTARDGFIPFYSSNPYTWGTLDDWESPQLSLLIECYVMARLAETESDVQDWLNHECVDDCNGDVTGCIESALPQSAWDKINELERAA